ncbi:MAG TPA: hypothetical protein PLB88_04675 [Thermoanaerobaculaceae bacterium]|nr:hypothetical protein [Thermoanaerobaculaceae bacterium]
MNAAETELVHRVMIRWSELIEALREQDRKGLSRQLDPDSPRCMMVAIPLLQLAVSAGLSPEAAITPEMREFIESYGF